MVRFAGIQVEIDDCVVHKLFDIGDGPERDEQIPFRKHPDDDAFPLTLSAIVFSSAKKSASPISSDILLWNTTACSMCLPQTPHGT